MTSLFLLEQIDGSAKEEPFLCIFAKKQQSNDSDIKKVISLWVVNIIIINLKRDELSKLFYFYVMSVYSFLFNGE